MFDLIEQLNSAPVLISCYRYFADYLKDDPTLTNERVGLPVDAKFLFLETIEIRLPHAGSLTHFSDSTRRRVHLELLDLLKTAKTYNDILQAPDGIDSINVDLKTMDIHFISDHECESKEALRFDQHPLRVSEVKALDKDEAEVKIHEAIGLISNSISMEFKRLYKEEWDKLVKSKAYRKKESDLMLAPDRKAMQYPKIPVDAIDPEFLNKFREKFRNLLRAEGRLDHTLSTQEFNQLFDEKSSDQLPLNWIGTKSHFAYLVDKLGDHLSIRNKWVVFSKLFLLEGEQVHNDKLKGNLDPAAKIPIDIQGFLQKIEDLYLKK